MCYENYKMNVPGLFSVVNYFYKTKAANNRFNVLFSASPDSQLCCGMILESCSGTPGLVRRMWLCSQCPFVYPSRFDAMPAFSLFACNLISYAVKLDIIAFMAMYVLHIYNNV